MVSSRTPFQERFEKIYEKNEYSVRFLHSIFIVIIFVYSVAPIIESFKIAFVINIVPVAISEEDTLQNFCQFFGGSLGMDSIVKGLSPFYHDHSFPIFCHIQRRSQALGRSAVGRSTLKTQNCDQFAISRCSRFAIIRKEQRIREFSLFVDVLVWAKRQFNL